MVADGVVLNCKQVVARRLWWITVADCITVAQLRQVLGRNPTEHCANFGKFFLRGIDKVTNKIIQRFVEQICRSLKRSRQMPRAFEISISSTKLNSTSFLRVRLYPTVPAYILLSYEIQLFHNAPKGLKGGVENIGGVYGECVCV